MWLTWLIFFIFDRDPPDKIVETNRKIQIASADSLAIFTVEPASDFLQLQNGGRNKTNVTSEIIFLSPFDDPDYFIYRIDNNDDNDHGGDDGGAAHAERCVEEIWASSDDEIDLLDLLFWGDDTDDDLTENIYDEELSVTSSSGSSIFQLPQQEYQATEAREDEDGVPFRRLFRISSRQFSTPYQPFEQEDEVGEPYQRLFQINSSRSSGSDRFFESYSTSEDSAIEDAERIFHALSIVKRLIHSKGLKQVQVKMKRCKIVSL
ncbi:unnamed protein product [Caenorhabditis auriculariae]|uniref:Uncharacterized protein n=1 Tax=Caenorhabditis auriculariae TaxID=2777116 RepID=A0A8S1GS23_9PELO|nr:unnamed protein product [Caenorhabditis auriculariae]